MNTICPDCNAEIRLKNQPRIGQIITCIVCQSSSQLISTEPAILTSLDAIWGENSPIAAPSHHPERKSKKQYAPFGGLEDFDLDDGYKPGRGEHGRSSKNKRSKRSHFEDFSQV